jgi:transposase InsO family protein
MSTEIGELSQRVFYAPDGKEKRFSPATIRKWLGRYRASGIDGLRNKPRRNKGRSSLPPALQQAFIDLRQQQQLWTIARVLDSLYKQGIWNGRQPGRSSMYRFAIANNLNRREPRKPLPVRPFEFPFFGDLWCADFLHGPMVRRGQFADKTYLHAIIDDATRYVVAARFHCAENTRSLLDDLMLAIRRFGIPKRFYTDNGAAFRSHHLRMVAARLTISLPHTPPYMPRGRGKIERFFRTVREGFLTGRERTSLDRLNADFSAWLNEYHHSRHSILKMTPLDRKLTDTGEPLKQIPPTQNINDIFRMEALKRVGSDGCIRMFNKRFEVSGEVPGSIIPVYYLPWEEDYILAGVDKIFVRPVNTIKNAHRFDRPRRGKQTDNTQEKSL